MSNDDFYVFVTAVGTVVVWVGILVFHAIGILYGKYLLHRPLSLPAYAEYQGVSILKPLVGVEPNLYKNLETFFTQDYPCFELLFSVQDEFDPAGMVVRRLQAVYPDVDAKLITGIQYVGPNNKINNMVRSFNVAKYNLILISDSCLLMKKETLKTMYSYMTPRVGMVLQLPYTLYREKLGFAAVYEQVFFGTWLAKNSLALNALGINCSSGQSALFRKEPIENIGGLGKLGIYMAEDHYLAEFIRKQKYKVVLCSLPSLQNSGVCSIRDFHNRLIRWTQLRYATLPKSMIIEPLSECLFLGILASWAVSFLLDVAPIEVFLFHVLLWFLMDYSMIRITQGGALPFSKFDFFIAWLYRELLVLTLHLRSYRSSTVQWRNKHLKLHWGGKITEV